MWYLTAAGPFAHRMGFLFKITIIYLTQVNPAEGALGLTDPDDFIKKKTFGVWYHIETFCS